jgi:hypothetical protein
MFPAFFFWCGWEGVKQVRSRLLRGTRP